MGSGWRWRKEIFFFLFVGLSLSCTRSIVRKEVSLTPVSGHAFGYDEWKTWDKFLYEGEFYKMEETPLTYFPDYKEWFFNEKVADKHFTTIDPIDKQYSAGWTIVDGRLYLWSFDLVHIKYTSEDIDSLVTVRGLETYTGRKALRTFPIAFDEELSRHSSLSLYTWYGLLSADWFTGDLYLRKQQDFLSDTSVTYKLSFRKGKLVD